MTILTNTELCREIRKIVGSKYPTDDYWFSREDMKRIIRRLNKSGSFITDDKSKKGYLLTSSLFPAYLDKIWNKQETVNTHPNRSNLISIYRSLKKVSEEASPAADYEITLESEQKQASLLSKIPNTLLDRAKEILITQDNVTISIKL
jgi:hypothetical protein